MWYCLTPCITGRGLHGPVPADQRRGMGATETGEARPRMAPRRQGAASKVGFYL